MTVSDGSSPLRFSSDSMPPRERVAFWREEFGRKMAGVDIAPDPDQPFRVEAVVRALPDVRLYTAECSPGRFGRTRELLADGNDDLCVVANLGGAAAAIRRGREVVLSLGEAVLISHTEPTAYLHSGGRIASVIVQRKVLSPLIAHIEDAAGRVISNRNEALRLLMRYLATMLDEAALLSPALQRLAATHNDLAALAIGATRDATEIAIGRGLRAARLRAVKANILADLASPNLSVAAVARRQSITPRYLHMLFESEGMSFSEFLLRERLDLARRMLVDPHQDHRTITEIAFAAGFGDLSHFNHAFRRRYGATPSEVRAAGD